MLYKKKKKKNNSDFAFTVHPLFNKHLHTNKALVTFFFLFLHKSKENLYSAASPSGDGSYCISWKMRRKTRRLKVTESRPNIDM